MSDRCQIDYVRSSLWLGAALSLALSLATPTYADGVTGAQARGAEQFLAALGSGGAQAVALAYHPAELDGLRNKLLARLRADQAKGDATVRAHLFGPAAQLADLERMTGPSLYAELAKRLDYRSREFKDVKWLASVPDGTSVHVIGRGKPLPDRGDVEVLATVTLLPYGKEWRAAIPSEIRAQIDDLIAGRGPRAAAAARAAAPAPASGAPILVDPQIGELLAAAEKSLLAGGCVEYYEQHMSPSFRRVTSKSALKALIAACERSVSTRETLIAAVRIVRTLTPRLEFDGARATYDVRGQGLPFERYVLERIDKRWYIAE
jgi:hypothetical protein